MSLQDEIARAKAQALQVHDLSAKLVATLTGDDVHAVAPAQSPAPPPDQPAKPPAATTPAGPVFEGECYMTCFLGKDDEGGEAPASPSDPPKVTALGIKVHYQDGMRIAGLALPWRVKPGRTFDVSYQGRTVVAVSEVDEGPWGTLDPWLENGARPIADGLKGQKVSWSKVQGRWVADPAGKYSCNGAGADGTPLLWAQLLGIPVAQVYANPPSGTVTIREYDAPPATLTTRPSTAPAADHTPGHLTLDDVAARARSGLPLDVEYSFGSGGKSGTTALPGTLLQSGVRQSDCSGFGDWCEGISRDVSGWNTDYAYNDATGPQKHYRLVPAGQAKPGHKLVASAAADGLSAGHEGVVSHVTNGIPDRVIHCSSMNSAGHAIAETDTSWFVKHHALVVEYLGLQAA